MKSVFRDTRPYSPSVLFCIFLAALVVLSSCAPVKKSRITESPKVAGLTGVSGKVVDRLGSAASGAYVFAYRSAVSGLRGPADFESVVDEEGTYFLDLSPGSYHLVARKRSSGSDNGPPRPGDDWGLFSRNPVQVEEGFTTFADLRLAGTGRPMLARRGEPAEKNVTLSGGVVDIAGSPVAGVFVLAYRDADFKGSPAFVSPPTDIEGRFSFAVSGPDTYCLVARSQTRGQPSRGELYGRLEGEGEGCVDAGKTGGLDVGRIVVTYWK